jgi:hypothetical protein
MSAGLSWEALHERRPDLTEGGRQLLYQHDVGLAFLATVRRDGGPRIHSFCPLLTADGIYGIIHPSPKQRDLRRDARYAVTSFPTPYNEDEFSITGVVKPIESTELRQQLGDQFVAEREKFEVPHPSDEDFMVEFMIETCQLTRTSGFGDWSPQHEIWRADR